MTLFSHRISFTIFLWIFRSLPVAASGRVPLLLLAGLPVWIFACSPDKKGKMDNDQILEILKAGEGARVFSNRYLNLDEDKGFETLAVVRAGGGEHLAIFKRDKNKDWKLAKKFSFTLPQYGYYQFHPQLRDWIPAPKEKAEKMEKDGRRVSPIFRRVVAKQAKGQKYNRLFVNFLTTSRPPVGGEPGKASAGGLHENLWVIDSREGTWQKIFDLDSRLAGEEDESLARLRKKKKIQFRPLDDGVLQIEPRSGGAELSLAWNGLTYSRVHPYGPLFYYYEAGLKKTEKAGEYEFFLNIKNNGASVSQAYLTASVEGGSFGKSLEAPESLRFYNPGSLVYHFGQKKKAPAKLPLLEIVRQPWKRNYRTKLRVIVKSQGAGKPRVLARIFAKGGGQEYSSPAGSGTVVPVSRDQQGKPAWVFVAE